MRGAAKHFNTLADVENSMTVDREGTKALLRKLKEGRFIWQDKGPLASATAGITDSTHRVVAVAAGDGVDAGGTSVPHQFELVEDPNAWMFRIGLTVQKIDQYLEA